MGRLSTSVVWQDFRGIVDLLDLWDLLVPWVFRVRKEKSGSQGDRVDLDSMASKVRKGIRAVDLDTAPLVLLVHLDPQDHPGLLVP